MTLLKKTLATIYKAFGRLNLDYADIIHDKLFNESLKNRLGKVQCRAALVISGAFEATSRDLLYKELGFESQTGSSGQSK